MQTNLKVNGENYTVIVDTRTTLLDVLRNTIGLTGTKKGCDQGQCGACTIIVNGRRINSCLTLACMHDVDEITTIEGLGSSENMSAMQAAFVKHDGVQCGYCTPGQICSATAMMDEIKAGWPSFVSQDLVNPETFSEQEISERMSGNLCRCSAYPNIVDAIKDAESKL